MKYNIDTFSFLNQPLYIAELVQFDESKVCYQKFLSSEELNILAKRKKKQKKIEFIFSRYIIKKTLGINEPQAKKVTIKYCNSTGITGVFQQNKLKQKLSLSHSGNFFAFSFCALGESIGVDIEVITNRDVKAIITEFFCEEDKDLIKINDDSTKFFYQLWTEKEAIAKLTNTSIFTLLAHSSAKLNSHYNIKSTTYKNFATSLAILDKN